MICPTCDGKRMVPILDWNGGWMPTPCPQCGGFGITHCCDGDQPNDYDSAAGHSGPCESATERRTGGLRPSGGMKPRREANSPSRASTAPHTRWRWE